MICYRITQCDTERSGNIFNRVFNKSRTRMDVEMLEKIMYLQSTLPNVYHLDVAALVKAWYNRGNYLPHSKKVGTESKVINRSKKDKRGVICNKSKP